MNHTGISALLLHNIYAINNLALLVYTSTRYKCTQTMHMLVHFADLLSKKAFSDLRLRGDFFNIQITTTNV